MNKKFRNKYGRPNSGNIKLKDVILIVTEGVLSEPKYLAKIKILKSESLTKRVTIYGHGNNSPNGLIKSAKSRFRKGELGKNDEIWIVLDVDKPNRNYYEPLFNWQNESPNQHKLAFSNPTIEYWFLLHVDEGKGVSDKNGCQSRLNTKIKNLTKNRMNYSKRNKVFPIRLITEETVKLAIKRAKLCDEIKNDDWPSKCGCTKVYKLIESLGFSKESTK